jgi:beta-phosphoglucomutase
MISAIVFDFDGVLADSEILHLRAYQEVLAPLGLTISRDDYFARYLGFDDDGVFRAVAKDRGTAVGDGEIEGLIARKAQVFKALEGSAEILFPGAVDCVQRLQAEFPLGIASGALRHEIQAVLDRSGLAGAFAFIVASGDTPASKPAPDPYLRAAALHGCPPAACIAIEDSRWGIASAKAAGLACIGITQTYQASELTAADAVIASLDEFTAELIRAIDRERADGLR